MSKNVIQLSYEEWLEQFTPVKNPVDPDASFDGYLIDTSKEELVWLAGQNRAKIWTLLETDGVLHISEGQHFVNRLGYFVTEVPRLRPEQFYEVRVSEDEDIDPDVLFPPVHFVCIGVSDVRRELNDAREGGFCYPSLDSMNDDQINDLLHYCYKRDMVIWEHVHVNIPELETIAHRWLAKVAEGGA